VFDLHDGIAAGAISGNPFSKCVYLGISPKNSRLSSSSTQAVFILIPYKVKWKTTLNDLTKKICSLLYLTIRNLRKGTQNYSFVPIDKKSMVSNGKKNRFLS
jgi:hypothetical protein